MYVSAYVKLRILWSLVRPCNCTALSAHGQGVSPIPSASANTAPPCCALGFVLESVCQAPLRGLAALETPATKVRCLFLPCLMLQHEPQAVLQREPLGGWKKESKHWIKRRTNPASAAALLWSPLRADFELTTVFPSSQAGPQLGREMGALLSPPFRRLGGPSVQCGSGCQGAASPYMEKGGQPSLVSFLPSSFPPPPPAPFLYPSPLLLPYLTSFSLLPSQGGSQVVTLIPFCTDSVIL